MSGIWPLERRRVGLYPKMEVSGLLIHAPRFSSAETQLAYRVPSFRYAKAALACAANFRKPVASHIQKNRGKRYLEIWLPTAIKR